MKITSYAHSDPGRVRKLNEDQVYIELEPARLAQRGELYLVADGMGGHLSGEIASQQAIESIVQGYYEATSLKPFQALKEAIEKANAVIYRRAREEQRPGMGTTIVAAARENDQLHVAHVGDSRLYLVRHGEIRQVTRDHSLVAEQVAAGILSEEEAAHHPQRNVISRAVGTAEKVKVEFASPLTLQEGDTIILCSDGLTEHLKAKQILSSLQGRSPKDACHALVEAANQAGGRDNISVIVCQVEKNQENAPTPPVKVTPSARKAKKRSPIIAMAPLLLVLLLSLVIGGGGWWLISSESTANEIGSSNSANSVSAPVASPSASPQATIAPLETAPPALESKTPSPVAPTVTKRPTFTVTAPSTEEPTSTATIPIPTIRATEVASEASVSQVPSSEVSPSPTSEVSPSPTSEASPSQEPTSEASPSQEPTSEASPSQEPTSEASPSPSSEVSPSPSQVPTSSPSEEPSLSSSITTTLESVPTVLPPQIILLAPDDGAETNESTLEFRAIIINIPENEQVELRMGKSKGNLDKKYNMQTENNISAITLNAPPESLTGEWFWQIVVLDLSTEESFSSEVRRLQWNHDS